MRIDAVPRTTMIGCHSNFVSRDAGVALDMRPFGRRSRLTNGA
jgi:hypothetical protein